jgi:thiol-disulfide isomerase/thioredoxin
MPRAASGASKTVAAGLKPGTVPLSPAEQNVVRFANNPQLVPPFLVRDLDGNIVSTAAWRGKVVLINFWATWCPPCRMEIPQLIELADRYKDRLLVIGISMDDSPPEEVKLFAKEAGINYPIVMAGREMISEFGGVPGLPTSYILNSDSRVVQKHVGLYAPIVYDNEVRALLGLPVDAKIETFEDTGQIFLKNASLATELPDVDFSGVSPEQKKAILKRLNSESCTCGCGLTLAQCRINDSGCGVSKKIAANIVKEILSGSPPATPNSKE